MEKLGMNIDFTNLKKINVYDCDDVKVGRIIDFVFTTEYKISKFILGGSAFEELKERIGLKPDDDPVISVSDISEINTSNGILKLTCRQSDFPNKLQDGAFAKNEILFSDFRKANVNSVDGQQIGKMVDAVFTDDNDVCFVLGDSKFVEFLEKIGLQENFDLLVPPRFIESTVGYEKIQLNQTKADLKVLLDNEEFKGKVFDYRQLKADQINSEVLRYSRYMG